MPKVNGDFEEFFRSTHTLRFIQLATYDRGAEKFEIVDGERRREPESTPYACGDTSFPRGFEKDESVLIVSPWSPEVPSPPDGCSARRSYGDPSDRD
jgi:hypothetical protein